MNRFFAGILITCWLLGGSSCSTETGLPGYEHWFLPSARQLKQGIGYKYYYHYKAPESYDIATDIQYRSLRLVDPDTLIEVYFNAGFDKSRSRVFLLEPDRILLLSDIWYSTKQDSLSLQIDAPVYLNWVADSAQAVTRQFWQEKEYLYHRRQSGIKDTLMLDRPAKIIEGSLDVRTVQPEEKDLYSYRTREYFIEGIGFWGDHLSNSESFATSELVEQMSMEEFQIRAQRLPPRIGYIDPADDRFPDSTFTLCESHDRIVDYYNGDPDAGYAKGKRALIKELKKGIDPAKIGDTSGYLSFRFVINCKGEAGWFVTEQCNLDFAPATFDPQTVQHLGELISRLSGWRPTTVREEIRDAYFYLTFKIRDGEIVHILP
jgi:hypothetical protein